MSDTKWTKEQLEAITEDGCNLLVAAAAGAGKTAVLVERIIRRITRRDNPVDIDRLLVVTFTNAAATEMRERIGAALEKALDNQPGDARLRRQLSLINKATITTIHSFCLDVIRNNFHCIDIDPTFRMADETEAALMKLEALEELFEEKYQQPEVGRFLELVECYGGKKDDGMLQQMVLELYEFVQSYPWPERWLREKIEIFNLPEDGDLDGTGWAAVLKESIKTRLEGLRDLMRSAVQIVENAPGLEPYFDTFVQDIDSLETLIGLAEGRWDELDSAFRSLQFTRLPRCGKEADGDTKNQVTGIRNKTKEQIKKISKEVFAATPDEMVQDLKRMYPIINSLSELVLEFEAKYSAKKREKSVLDFGDLEHFCLEILLQRDGGGNVVPSRTALSYRDRFDEILVDEYQDSNMVQEVIINSISGGAHKKPRVFVVGDVKQSIYRFRHARPELFMSKYDRYPLNTGGSDRKILLYKNFRSRKSIIHAVNMVFGYIMSKTVGEIDYTEGEALNPGAVYPESGDEAVDVGGRVELHIIDREDRGDTPEQGPNGGDDQPDAVQAEAILVAERIKQLVQPPPGQRPLMVYDRRLGQYRDVEYRDIVVLMRTTSNWAQTFVEEFELAGIPVYADISTGYFQTVEIQVMMSLLKIIDNPMQDIPMLSVLRSPIGAFTPEELTDIRLHDTQSAFFQAMKTVAAEEEGRTAAKVKGFLSRLEGWRDRSVHMSTDQLIWYLFSDTGYYSYIGTMPGGMQKQANLRMLYERAGQYEQTSYRGLFNFINFIDKIKSGSSDMGSARILAENENVVRVMSIHKSKGLEFPVVVLAGCGKRFNFQDTARKLLVHPDLGFGPEFIDPQRRVCYPTIAKQALKYRLKLETLSEEMRIMYVAFTRAREKLIITGSVRSLDKKLDGWRYATGNSSKLPKYQAITASSFFDWLCPALIDRHDRLWRIEKWNKDSLGRESAAAGGETGLAPEDVQRILADIQPGEYSQEVAKRLEWKYRYQKSDRLPVKLSVSELKKRIQTEFAEEYMPVYAYPSPVASKPSFLDETKGFSAAQRGSILHFIMQHLDLERSLDGDDIKTQIREMVAQELLTPQEMKTVDTEGLEGFFNSALGRRMLKSNNVKREVPFNIEITSTDVYDGLDPDIYDGETIILQGVIDCCFEEDGKMILIDYKTDKHRKQEDGSKQGNQGNQGDGSSDPGGVSPLPGVEDIKEKYRPQMQHYAYALGRITGKPVTGRYLYLFYSGQIVEY